MLSRMQEKICTLCGEVGYERGMGGVQAFVGGLLCVAGVLPGLVYFAVLSSRYPCCPACQGRKSMVPLNSRVGRRLLRESAGDAEEPIRPNTPPLPPPPSPPPTSDLLNTIVAVIIAVSILLLIWLGITSK